MASIRYRASHKGLKGRWIVRKGALIEQSFTCLEDAQAFAAEIEKQFPGKSHRSGKYVSPAQWERYCETIEQGDITLRDFCREYGLNERTMFRKLRAYRNRKGAQT